MGRTALLLISLAAGSAGLQGGAAGTHLPSTRGWLAFTPSPDEAGLLLGTRGDSCTQRHGTASAAGLGCIRMVGQDVAVFMSAFKTAPGAVYKKEWNEFLDAFVADRDERGEGVEQNPLRGETGWMRDVISVKDALVRWHSHSD
ncbi:hypothetical protein T484DRAFT_1752780 [Baffinella frigidus]|nr:hypothetical protein T484DRAFT_1752780 [Cryptophyta sp. CCMP2293]